MGELFRLTHADLKPAIAVLTRSLHDDPLFRRLIPDDEQRKALLPKILSYLVREGLLCGEVFVTSPAMEGVAVWHRPSVAASTFAKLFRAGFAEIPFVCGMKLSYRLHMCHEHLDGLRSRYVPLPHWNLQLLGVDPSQQRRGYGQRLLEPMLRRFDCDQAVCCLDTQNSVNVAYYERYGFRVVTAVSFQRQTLTTGSWCGRRSFATAFNSAAWQKLACKIHLSQEWTFFRDALAVGPIRCGRRCGRTASSATGGASQLERWQTAEALAPAIRPVLPPGAAETCPEA
jgi:ribosomal protein S18 acetylase RimI-like enzyme